MSEPARSRDGPNGALPDPGRAGPAAGRRIVFINVFRAGAAYWVLCAHCMIWGGWFWLPLPPAKSAVDLFMMISGYLMAANASARSRAEPLTGSFCPCPG